MMMKTTFVCLIALVSSATAFADDADYYKVSELTVREVVPTPAELYSDYLLPQTDVAPAPAPLQSIDWNAMVLIGEKLIEIVKAGKPVVNLRRDAVAVVPQGVTAWDQLSNWQAPNTKVYSVTSKNYLGLTVVDLRLKVSAMYGGGIDGKGKFLANVIVVPSSISVLWGFNLDVWTENRSPVNMGSAADPVAGLGFDLRFRYGSAVVEKVGAQDYFVTGTGEIKEMQ
jgi:hypothetical protein